MIDAMWHPLSGLPEDIDAGYHVAFFWQQNPTALIHVAERLSP